MTRTAVKKTILFVDDDEDDFMLMRDIFKERFPDVELQWVKDGEMALDYLQRSGPFHAIPKPSIILLDLNMPKLNGQEVLKNIRSSEALQCTPVVVLTNSMNAEEAEEAYCAGVTSFMRKPSGYKQLCDFVDIFGKYWFEFSTLV